MFARISLILALCLSITACGDGTEEDIDFEQQSHDLVLPAPIGFQIDSTLLEPRPRRLLPQRPLTADSFRPLNVARSLVETQENFAADERSFATRQIETSPSWHLEIDATSGLLLVGRRDAAGRPQQPLGQDPLQRDPFRLDALRRLGRWGIGADEIARSLQRPLMRQVEELGRLGEPVVHRHKTFVFRGIGGVPVEGHRAVITYRPDGAFQRALISWPPLAPAGHRLTSALAVGEIERRVRDTLRAAGETRGAVRLSWKYVPTLRADGTVTVELVVSARLAEVSHADLSEEARVFDIAVDAR